MWVGWLREGKRGRWCRVCAAATYAAAWQLLLARSGVAQFAELLVRPAAAGKP